MKASITSVKFIEYKAFQNFSISLSGMNILVGPNNNGKSTVIGAFRILAQAMRIARSRNSEILWGPNGQRPAWRIPADQIPVSSENIHTDYDHIDTFVEFRVSTGATLTLFFPDDGGCKFYADSATGYIRSPSDLRRHVPISVAVVPILGPLEHEEKAVSEETVRKNLLTTRASRHFRNYWHYNPEGFDDYADLVESTWPGMTITPPERSDENYVMFCQENRRDRELFWSGFGFQIWLQLLAHVSRSRDASILVVDEPELYLHPDIQLQLLSILREAGPDVLVATHSTEIMSEADPSEIILVDKKRRSGERLRDVEGVQRALDAIGSIQNITLTRLARTRKIVFTEGVTDYRLVRRFAQKMSYSDLAAGADLTAMESGGFSGWDKVRSLAEAFEEALGFELNVGAIFDRDFWCDEAIADMGAKLAAHLTFFHIHKRKEIENYLLVPDVLDRAIAAAKRERSDRTGDLPAPQPEGYSARILGEICERVRAGIQSQYIAKRLHHFGKSGRDAATITEEAVRWFDAKWQSPESKLSIVPGKQVLREYREQVMQEVGVNVTDARIVSTFRIEEVDPDIQQLLRKLDEFRL
jgi:predicted ATPase